MDKSLAPGFVRQTYNTEFSGAHHLVQTVKFDGTPVPGSEPQLLTKDGTSIGLEDAWSGFLDHFLRFFDDSALFGLVECYAVNAETGEGTFLYAFNAAAVGSTSGTTVKWGEAVATFKTIGGHNVRLYAMEGIIAVDQIFHPPFTIDSALDELAVYVSGDESIIYGRDGTFVFTPISVKTKTADTLRKRGLN